MTGAGSQETIVSLFLAQLARGGDQTAIHVRRGRDFAPLAWKQVGGDVCRAAAALARLGVEKGERVAMVSPNRYEWIVCDLAIQIAGGVHVPIHASLSGAQIAHQIVDSQSVAVILSGAEQSEKLIREANRFPNALRVVAFDACPDAWEHFHFLRFSELMAEVDEAEARSIQRTAQAEVQPDDLATILYTSGTTGEPKGVMLSQRNLASNAEASTYAFGPRADDLRLTWLPLSHIFARTCDLYTWLAAGHELALADSPEAVVGNCGQLRPTLINGVPYFYEKVQRYLSERGETATPGALAALLGGRMRVCVSGGAPLPEHVGRFYESQRVLLLQGYGLTESSPVISTETEAAHKPGTVGKPIPGVEVQIAGDGEVLTRGPHVMLGYWNNPAATDDVIRDGWLATGDLGEIDAQGFLRITGRKKELIVTAGGKNIAPAYLEALLTEDPLISQALVVGDGRNYLTALIVPDDAALAAAIRSERIEPAADALSDVRVRRLFQRSIERRLSVVSRYEQIGDFVLVSRSFSIDRGELTPTLKLRRAAIQANFAEEIAAMYREDRRPEALAGQTS